MKTLNRVTIAALCLMPILMSADGCEPKENLVTMTYQHLANFQSWNLDNKAGGDAKGMWHVYMLRGIINQGKKASDINFDLQKLRAQGGGTVNSSSSAMLHAEPYTMALNFQTKVKAGSAFTIPYGQGVLFFIKQEDDTEQTVQTNLIYGGGTTDASILTVPLDGAAPVMYGQLDQAFLEKIHQKQNEYENKYHSDGSKS